MNNIFIETRGVKGEEIENKTVGYVVVELRNCQGTIIVDDFIGCGNTYKQREHQLIEIMENGTVLFSGNKEELFKILKRK